MGLLSRACPPGGRLAALAAAALLTLGAASEVELKSALVFQIARLVEWPKGAVSADVLRVTVLGEGSFAETVEAMIDGQSVHGRRIRVRRAEALAELPPCEILVVAGEPASMEAMQEVLGDAPVLTIGDAPDFARRGGMIGLVRDGPRMGLEVNRAAIAVHGLRVSSQLLRLGTAVDD